MCSIGLLIAVPIYALGCLFAITILGIPVAMALFVIATRILTLRF
jgi:hypothetical protein